MSFEIDRRERDGVTVLAPHGRIVIGERVETFRNTIDSLMAEGHNRIVLDLTDVDYIDSSALGCLVFAYTRITKAGGAMPIFGLNRRNIELLVITKLATIFRIADNEMDAINLCYPDRATRPFDILSFVEQQRSEAKGSSVE